MFDLIRSIQQRDPASPTICEVIFGYAGFHVMLFHRTSHFLWKLKLRAFARFIAQLGRWLTGIEIHPGAQIGKNLFIDHGMGVVIGETTVIGDHVTLYHGVTLGGHGKAGKGERRHPTLKDDVTVGAGAQVLGNITLEKGACVGSNSVVTASVPEGVTVIGSPARKIGANRPGEAAFHAYGIPDQKMVDPMVHVINGLVADMTLVKEKLDIPVDKTKPATALDSDENGLWNGAEI